MNIRDYAHLSCGGQDWTQAFMQAISDMRAQGGGVLTVPAGDYPTGSIRLYDNMTLNVESGARIAFLQDDKAFPLIIGGMLLLFWLLGMGGGGGRRGRGGGAGHLLAGMLLGSMMRGRSPYGGFGGGGFGGYDSGDSFGGFGGGDSGGGGASSNW